MAERAADDELRQQVLLLCLHTPELHARVIAWTFHDGSGARAELPARSHGRPPYDTGVDALEDGWRLIQMTPPPTPTPGHEHQLSFLKHEYLFERLVPRAE